MNSQAMGYLAAAIIIGLGTIGPALAIGMMSKAALEGMARQPEAASRIQNALFIALAFAEAIALYALVASILLIFTAK